MWFDTLGLCDTVLYHYTVLIGVMIMKYFKFISHAHWTSPSEGLVYKACSFESANSFGPNIVP